MGQKNKKRVVCEWSASGWEVGVHASEIACCMYIQGRVESDLESSLLKGQRPLGSFRVVASSVCRVRGGSLMFSIVERVICVWSGGGVDGTAVTKGLGSVCLRCRLCRTCASAGWNKTPQAASGRRAQ